MDTRPHGGPNRFGRGPVISLLGRAVLIGLVFLLLPPTGELPYRWQAALAFPLLAGWCYLRGAWGRHDVQLATLEAIPTLWLALKCTDGMVRLLALWS